MLEFLHEKFKRYVLCIFVLASLLLSSCEKQDPLLTEADTPEHIVLFYMAANNDFTEDALESFRKIRQGYMFDPNCRTLIYLKTETNRSHFLTLQSNSLDTLQTYRNENLSDPNFLKKVISDSRAKYPSKITGLVMWPHAIFWKPKPKIKSFGQDEGVEMDIKNLAASLPEDLEFLVFDACTMASIEVLYELKNRFKYMLALPAEILTTSFPCEQSINNLFSDVEGLKEVADNFITYYRNQTVLCQSATISLIQTDHFDSVALETRKLLLLRLPVYPFNKKKIQQLTFDVSNNVPSYDLISFLSNNYEYSTYSELEKAIQKAVLFKVNTALFLGDEITNYCGLSVYLPELGDPYFDYYSSLRWNSVAPCF
jgi:hypothetical protein